MDTDGSDREDHAAEYLKRGDQHLRRAHLTLAALALLFVGHLEFLLIPCVRMLGVFGGFLAVAYPIVLGAFIVWLLLRPLRPR